MKINSFILANMNGLQLYLQSLLNIKHVNYGGNYLDKSFNCIEKKHRFTISELQI